MIVTRCFGSTTLNVMEVAYGSMTLATTEVVPKN